MSLTASSLESARRKFFNRRCVKKTFFHELARIGAEHRRTCVKTRNQTFLGSGDRIESNIHQLARIGQMKIFHELDAEHV